MTAGSDVSIAVIDDDCYHINCAPALRRFFLCTQIVKQKQKKPGFTGIWPNGPITIHSGLSPDPLTDPKKEIPGMFFSGEEIKVVPAEAPKARARGWNLLGISRNLPDNLPSHFTSSRGQQDRMWVGCWEKRGGFTVEGLMERGGSWGQRTRLSHRFRQICT